MKLEVRNLHFHYKDGPCLADDISFSLEPGCFTMLLGPNGCGKSTLLRLMSGELKPDSGAILLDDVPVRTCPGKNRARHIGIVLQSASPALDFTVREYVAIGRSPHLSVLSSPSEEDHDKILEAMKVFEIDHLADRFCNSLSGGERQRTMLASAWANEPDVLLLDEPTSATDPAHTMLILKNMKQKSADAAVFMITHDLLLAANMADRVMLMRDGRIFSSGTPRDVLTPENIRKLYDIEVKIIDSDNRNIAILPVYREGTL